VAPPSPLHGFTSRASRVRLHRWLIWVFLTTTLALVGLTAFDLVRLALEARATVDSVGDVRWHVDSAIADADALRDGGDTLESAAARLSEIERRLDRYGPALAVASIVPPLRRRIEETQALLAIHVDLSSAGAMSLDVAAGLLDRLTGTGESRDEPLPARSKPSRPSANQFAVNWHLSSAPAPGWTP